MLKEDDRFTWEEFKGEHIPALNVLDISQANQENLNHNAGVQQSNLHAVL